MKIVAAAIQFRAEPGARADNLERADACLAAARGAGADLAVLPEMFNTGYGLIPDYGPLAERRDGPTLSLLRERSRDWRMSIAAGFVEDDGSHLYDALAFCTPEGELAVYRKRNLVFWERSRFYPGRDSVVVATRWGRVGLAVCADMIYRKVWRDYRDRVDAAVIVAAWPNFADRETGRKDWLLGRIGPMAAAIPGKVAADLKIPVVFANQCGPTSTVVPVLKTVIRDRFAGRSSISDGLHGPPLVAGLDEQVLLSELTLHPRKGPHACPTTSSSVSAA